MNNPLMNKYPQIFCGMPISDEGDRTHSYCLTVIFSLNQTPVRQTHIASAPTNAFTKLICSIKMTKRGNMNEQTCDTYIHTHVYTYE